MCNIIVFGSGLISGLAAIVFAGYCSSAGWFESGKMTYAAIPTVFVICFLVCCFVLALLAGSGNHRPYPTSNHKRR